MIPPVVHEIQARSALNPVQNMPFKWSLNPYKGCSHGCAYCYARAYHSYLDLSPSAFESQLFVKTNVATVLKAELMRGVAFGEGIAVGTATDPYQPLEGQYRLTRRCLELMADFAQPGAVTTKGTLVTRDLDVLSDLAQRARFLVHISLISLDKALLHRIEPGAPSPTARLNAIEKLANAGVPVSVFLAPVLPGLTDQPAQLEAVVRAAAERGACDVWSGALRLGPGVREHFLGVMREYFPAAAPRFERMYSASSNAPPGFQPRLSQSLDRMREDAHLPGVPKGPVANPIVRQGQLALPM
jgi:DNA repair photolyase